MLMVVLVVIRIVFAHIRSLEVVSILIGVLKVNFTEFDHGRKQFDWKGHSRFSGEPY